MASARETMASLRDRVRFGALLGGLVCTTIACQIEPLPAVREPSLFAAPPTCVRVPEPPLLLLEDPSDPRRCVPLSFDRRVTVGFTVVDGQVAELTFYDSCTGIRTEVDASIADCVRTSLGTWRYLAWDGCPGQDFRAMDSKELYRVPGGTRTPVEPSCDP